MSVMVATRYAKALYRLGKESGNLDELTREIGQLSALVTEHAELRDTLANPAVPPASKRAILSEIADRLGVSTTAKNAFMFIGERRRLGMLSSIAERLREITESENGVVRAEVASAAPLDDAYQAKLKKQLESMTGKRVILDCRHEPELIAGVVTRIGDTVYDGSLKARLESLKLALMPN